MRLQRFDAPRLSIGSIAKPILAALQIFHQRRGKAQRQPLPAMRFGRGERHPAALDERGIGLAKPRRHRHHAVRPLRPDRVADPVERRELPLGERRRAFEHRVDHVRVIAELADPHDMVENQALVANRAGESSYSSHPLKLVRAMP